MGLRVETINTMGSIKGIMWMKSLIPRTGPLASLQDKALASNV